MKKAQENISQIANFNWSKMSIYDILYLSLTTAYEFAESLRIAQKFYPENKDIAAVASGELLTDNLYYENYRRPGDHADYLAYFFVRKNLGRRVSLKAQVSADIYLIKCESFTDGQRAMSIISREQELHKIFEKIVSSHNWKSNSLDFYEHYLLEHIRFDSQEGGHGDLLSKLPLNEKYLDEFWAARFDLYNSAM